MQDVQGSTRAVMSGNAIVARHDFLPFGEEIGSGMGLRTQGQGYGAVDRIRQRYGMTERDDSSGLDHTWFRKYESFAGRWTSPDPLGGSINDPQSLNSYSYAANDPVNLIDPDGQLPGIWQYSYGAEHGWADVSAGFWGSGSLANRPHRRDWALEDKPAPLLCPPDKICFWESLDDKRFRLVPFSPSDFLGFYPQNPTKEQWTIIDDAVSTAFKLLDSKSCRKAITGNADVDPRGLLEFLQESDALAVGNSSGSVAEVPPGFDIGRDNITLQPNFFQSAVETRQYYSPTGKVQQLATPSLGRAVAILHELRHIFNNGNHPVGNPFPFNNEILKACFGINAGYPKGYGPSSTNIRSGP